MKKLILLTLVIVIALTGIQSRAQELDDIKRICTLEPVLEETSGLIWLNGHLWTHNDSGNSNELFCIDTTSCNILRTVEISNAVNTDWEDICTDDKYVYIGDFGNNNGNRTDLCIYRISGDVVMNESVEQVEADSIRFFYPNQEQFEWENYSTNFDCEAMIAYDDSLYLFSKNWGNLKTYLYALPKTPGEHPATLLDSFNVDGLITGADIDTTDNRIVLLAYNQYMTNTFIVVLDAYQGNHFFSGNITTLKLGLSFHQTEGIAIDNNNILISNETFSSNEAALHKTKLIYDYIPPVILPDGPDYYPNPAGKSLHIVNCTPFNRLYITNIRGHIMLEKSIKSDSITLQFPFLNSGLYIIEMQGKNASFTDVLVIE